MKHHFLFFALLGWVITLFPSCNDNLSQIGYNIQPGGDGIEVTTGTLNLSASTLNVDSIYMKTKYPVLGEYSDPVYGTIKSDYIGQFYYSEASKFASGAVIDSVRLTVYYSSLIGDSLAPMQISAYPVNKALPAKAYNNIDPTEYCDMSSPIGSQSFTGKNADYEDIPYSYYSYTYYTTIYDTLRVYHININLPNSLGEDFLQEFNDPSSTAFKNADAFNEYFRGLYITPTFGNSTIVNVSQTSINVNYHYIKAGGASTGADTTLTSVFTLTMTPEVIQINHIANKHADLLPDNSEKTYVASPAGVDTKIVFPLSQIQDKLKTGSLNQAYFSIKALTENNYDNNLVKISPPTYMMLIHQDSLKSFFEKGKLMDSKTSFLATFSSTSYTYDFGNIATMINYYKEVDKYKNGTETFDLPFLLVPVDVSTSSSTSSSSTVYTAVHNLMMPAAVTLSKKPEDMKIDLIFSAFK
ncbi:MAG: DUF4270 domain-containing protein [Dysgonamonadaceae bacterium]|jgi:hypothetical protein|nr:DUF4270 domain-containing protein [Dysgonamonadaceae bacterium]